MFNEEQQKCIDFYTGSALVIAGAGSGKTTVIINRLSELLKKGIKPENILLLTFTNKAAEEMLNRAKILIKDDKINLDDITACTYHSFCAILLRQYGYLIKLNSNFTMLDNTDCIDVLKLIRQECNKDKDKGFPKPSELINIYSMLNNRELSLDEIDELKDFKYKPYLEDIKIIYQKYIEFKLDKNLLDYDDLLIKTNQLLFNNKDICEILSDKYKFIMVDEYQDSNNLQSNILKMLRQFPNKNIMVVGDDNQSLYRWRGANVENILDFPKQFNGCKKIILNQNYRSNQEILDLANQIVKQIRYKYDKDLYGQYSLGKKPLLIYSKSVFDEAKYIYSDINNKLKTGHSPSDIAILIRGSNDSSTLELLLTSQHLKYQKFGGVKFLERPDIKNILAYLKVIVNKKDEIAWFRLLQLYKNIGIINAKKISQNIVKNGPDELIDKKYKKRNCKEGLEKLYDVLTNISSKDYKDILPFILDYYFELAKNNINNMDTDINKKTELLKNLNEIKNQSVVLIDMSKNYSTLNKFLTAITLEAPNPTEKENSITISTIHSAKGLEFKTVYILNCTDGGFPWIRESNSINPKIQKEEFMQMEEEKRCFYVAITRAKENLILSYPQTSRTFKGYEYLPISRFLTQNIIDDYLDTYIIS